jgi:predicted nuclease of predicted toxin-antitoxin system
MRRSKRTRLYADEQMNNHFIHDVRRKHINIRTTSEIGRRGNIDAQQIQIANNEERCIITQDHDFLRQRRLLGLLRYGVIIIEADLSNPKIRNTIFELVVLALEWGKEIFRRKLIVTITPTSMVRRYRTKAGRTEKEKFKLEGHKIWKWHES